VLGISYDTPQDNAAFRAKHGFPFRLLSDPDRSVGAAYGVVRPPEDRFAQWPRRLSFLIDPEGTIVRVYEVNDPAGHATEVLADLAAARR
jgi:peroxiredoxin Q/BCP